MQIWVMKVRKYKWFLIKGNVDHHTYFVCACASAHI